MSADEKQDRMLALHEEYSETMSSPGVTGFCRCLTLPQRLAVRQLRDNPPQLSANQIADAYRQSARRLLLLDYDGTLVPLASRPHEAAPENDLRTSRVS